MMRKHASLVIAVCLVALVATACLIRTSRPPAQRGQPVYVEDGKHKPRKHKKVKHRKVKHKKHRD